jgi:hypothetical protein
VKSKSESIDCKERTSIRSSQPGMLKLSRESVSYDRTGDATVPSTKRRVGG